MSLASVDSIGQGRIWTGNRAITLGLVDRTGGLGDAIRSAAALAKLKGWRVREYPEQMNFLERITGAYKHTVETGALKEAIGEEFHGIYQEWKSIRSTIGQAQAKMPFHLIFH